MKLSRANLAQSAVLPPDLQVLSWPGLSQRPPAQGIPASAAGLFFCAMDALFAGLTGVALQHAISAGVAGATIVPYMLVSAIAIGLVELPSRDIDPDMLLARLSRPTVRNLGYVLAMAAAFAICIGITAVDQQNSIPRLSFIAVHLGVLLGVLNAFRWAVLAWVRPERIIRPLRLAVIGTEGAQERAFARLQAASRPLHYVVATCNPSGSAGSFQGRLQRNQLIRMIRHNAVDRVLIDPLGLKSNDLEAVTEDLLETPAELWLSTDGPSGVSNLRREQKKEPTADMVFLRRGPLSGWRRSAKRAEDLLVAGLALVLVAPLMLLIAFVIRADSPGPALFRQERYGWNNRRISVLKFRTMRHEGADVAGARQASRDDQRVTRVGRVLRRYSLDELPQLFNVLWGSMSVVGPRPHALETKAGGVLFERAVPHYAARHNVKPGITGLAQVKGWRGPTETIRHLERRTWHDLEYVEKWSLWLDIAIMARTVPSLLRRQNAF